jgi:hypothetical protein
LAKPARTLASSQACRTSLANSYTLNRAVFPVFSPVRKDSGAESGSLQALARLSTKITELRRSRLRPVHCVQWLHRLNVSLLEKFAIRPQPHSLASAAVGFPARVWMRIVPAAASFSKRSLIGAAPSLLSFPGSSLCVLRTDGRAAVWHVPWHAGKAGRRGSGYFEPINHTPLRTVEVHGGRLAGRCKDEPAAVGRARVRRFWMGDDGPVARARNRRPV